MRLGILVAVMLGACASDEINGGGHFHATWALTLDSSPCAAYEVAGVRFTVIDGTGFQTLQEAPCEDGSLDSPAFEPGSYKLLLDALGADRIAIKEAAGFTLPIRNGLATDVSFFFDFQPPPTTGKISVFSSVNGSNLNCPVNATYDVMLDGAMRQVAACGGSIGYFDVAPGAHTLDGNLADGTNLFSSTAPATVTAGMNTIVMLDFTIP